MAYTKRKKQPHLFRDRSIDPTKQVRLQMANVAASPVEPVQVGADESACKPAHKRARKRATLH